MDGWICTGKFSRKRKRSRASQKPKRRKEKRRIYGESDMEQEFKKWRFPSSYVKIGEHPDDTLTRVMIDQLGMNNFKVERSRLVSYYYPSRRYPGEMHWDYCFINEVKSSEAPREKPWFKEIRYVHVQELKEEDFGSAQGALLELFRGQHQPL
ncbi:hypothetical protein B9Q03_11665 [Candidatus Marsarchaeota G2 archaeon OSP_D]|uniref:Uncharacterized protein n=2 Tax=Candidatus Marsarchaeota TaxID=1978152 RepID=A0A2R6AJF9_9ARCH|nr:MAG: hypothetical protein B9Q03_11665 [Candidatus Marsarchaeota G2 archaeon OSP_D]